MPLFEVVFRRPGEADEVVVVNFDPRREGYVVVGGRRWTIVKTEAGDDRIERRYIAVVAAE